MASFYLLKGLILGFSIAAPVGPIGVLCIRRTLAYGLLSGFLSGLGTACADAVYGIIAAFGLSFISAFLLTNQFFLHLSGGIFLLYLGFTTFQASPSKEAAATHEKGLWTSYTSAFFLTLTNPMTILSFAAIFAGLQIGTTGETLQASLLVLGVFLGSLIWWLILSSAVNLLRFAFNHSRLRWLNRFSGTVIVALGIMSLAAI